MIPDGPRGGERGSAVIEFIVMTCAVVVPLTYLVGVLGSVQGAVFAAEAGSRAAARIVSIDRQADAWARDIAAASADAHGAHLDSLTWFCEPEPCAAGVSAIRVDVTVRARLPLLPQWASGVAVPVRASSSAPVEGVVLVH